MGTREALARSGAELPDDEHLASQISAPHYYYRKGASLHGALMIEPKEQMTRRGLASPDRADTLMLTHAVDPAPKETEATRDERRYSERMPPTGWTCKGGRVDTDGFLHAGTRALLLTCQTLGEPVVTHEFF